MKTFAELGIKPLAGDKTIFEVQKISIGEILNCEIEVIDFESGVKTVHGDNRYVVKIRFNNTEYKFFTDAKPIKNALDQIDKKEFPFKATIRIKSYGTGNGKTYEFT